MAAWLRLLGTYGGGRAGDARVTAAPLPLLMSSS